MQPRFVVVHWRLLVILWHNCYTNGKLNQQTGLTSQLITRSSFLSWPYSLWVLCVLGCRILWEKSRMLSSYLLITCHSSCGGIGLECTFIYACRGIFVWNFMLLIIYACMYRNFYMKYMLLVIYVCMYRYFKKKCMLLAIYVCIYGVQVLHAIGYLFIHVSSRIWSFYYYY